MKYPNLEAEQARHQLSRGDIASILHVDRTTVNNWQSGRTDMPVMKLIALADFFGVSTDYLLGRTTQ